MARDMDEVWERWDRGEHVFPEAFEELMDIEPGEKLGSVLSECTICPVGNGTCGSYIDAKGLGELPVKAPVVKRVMICTLGVKDIDHCPLSK